jgi:LDH2 family malate/lactate/ureidoglycolate dehydrogenase
MQIQISDLTQKVHQYLHAARLTESDALTLSDLIVEQEIIGNQFSRIGELAEKYPLLTDNHYTASSETVVDKPALRLIKGNGRLAPLITADHLDEGIQKAKSQGIYAIGIYDSTYNDFLMCFVVAQQRKTVSQS